MKSSLTVRAALRVSVVGVAAAADYLVRLPIWRHHYGEWLKELAAQMLAWPTAAACIGAR